MGEDKMVSGQQYCGVFETLFHLVALVTNSSAATEGADGSFVSRSVLGSCLEHATSLRAVFGLAATESRVSIGRPAVVVVAVLQVPCVLTVPYRVDPVTPCIETFEELAVWRGVVSVFVLAQGKTLQRL
ncbi:unnamed protein product [Ectocarpus sp. 8 AP-2014]